MNTTGNTHSLLMSKNDITGLSGEEDDGNKEVVSDKKNFELNKEKYDRFNLINEACENPGRKASSDE